MRRVFAIILLLFAVSAYAAESYRLEADQISGQDNVSFTAKGNVVLTFKNSEVHADEVTYYPQQRVIEASGNVTIKDDLQELTAERITYSLDTESGDIDNATGIIAGEYYICAKYMNRVSEKQYIMGGVRVTTCSSPFPEWSFSFHRAEAEIDGYIWGDHATGNIFDMPFLYSPKLVFPLKLNRQTGFLLPMAGYDSDFGTFVSDQFFWAIDYDKDITVGATAFSDRGLMWLGEARYEISSKSHIYLAGDRLNDSESYVSKDKRWRYVSKSRVVAPYGFEFVADADIVSDFMYMRDLSGYGMYEPGVRNDENIYYEQYHAVWRSKWTNAQIHYRSKLDFTDTTTVARSTRLTEQPTISLSKIGLNLGYFNASYKASYGRVKYENYRHNFTTTTPPTTTEEFYDRLYADASVYKTFRLPIMRLTPSVTGHYTKWYNMNPQPTRVTENRETPLAYIAQSGSGYMRVYPEISLRGNINEIYKYYGKSKHGILNTISYRFIQELDDRGLPNDLTEDIVEENNEIAWTMRNYFTHNNFSIDLTLIQAFEFNGMPQQPDDKFEPLVVRGGFSIKGLGAEFNNYVRADVDHYAYRNARSYDPVDNITDTMNMKYKNFTGYASYLFSRDINIDNDYNTSMTIGAGLEFKRVDLFGYMKWQGHNVILSFTKLAPVEGRVTAIWKDQCWNLGLSVYSEKYVDVFTAARRPEREYSVEVVFTLKGLGESSISAYNYDKTY